jgi:hypothetical protein
MDFLANGNIDIKNVTITANGHNILTTIYYFDQSCYIWLGTNSSEHIMGSLVVSMPTKYDIMPLSTTLMEDQSIDVDNIGVSLSQRISKVLNIQCFVSYNIPSEFSIAAHQIEREIINILKPQYAVQQNNK